MNPAYKDIQEQAAVLLKAFKVTTTLEQQNKISHQLHVLNEKLCAAYEADGFTIRHQAKLRFTAHRGLYYNQKAAEEVKSLIATSNEGDVVGARLTTSSALQYLRLGLAFLCENMDPTGEYNEWDNNFSFAKRGGDVKILRKNAVVGIKTPVVKNLNWQLKIIEWMQTPGNLEELEVQLTSLNEFQRLNTFLLKYPGVEIKNIDGMTVTIHVN